MKKDKVAVKIKQLRHMAGDSQVEAAKALRKSDMTIKRWEDKKLPNEPTLSQAIIMMKRAGLTKDQVWNIFLSE